MWACNRLISQLSGYCRSHALAFLSTRERGGVPEITHTPKPVVSRDLWASFQRRLRIAAVLGFGGGGEGHSTWACREEVVQPNVLCHVMWQQKTKSLKGWISVT